MLSFSSIVGHRALTMLLSQAIARQTLPPTLLLAGPPGVGKYRVARAVAAALNCQAPLRGADGLPFDACQACRSCDRIARGVHVDVHVLEPDERASIKIDVVRELLDRTGFRPFEGQRRVAIVRDADALEHAAQNSLLKSLEEPPPSTVFLLTTSLPDALLPTVRSRCMRLRFGRLTAREVATVLMREHDIPEGEALATAALADGRIGEALALQSADVAVLREIALLMLKTAGAGPAAAARLRAAGTLAVEAPKKDRPREDVALALRLMGSMLRDIELLKANGDRRVLANPAVVDELEPLARRFPGGRARDAFVAVERALIALERNAGTKVVSEWLATQM